MLTLPEHPGYLLNFHLHIPGGVEWSFFFTQQDALDLYMDLLIHNPVPLLVYFWKKHTITGDIVEHIERAATYTKSDFLFTEFKRAYSHIDGPALVYPVYFRKSSKESWQPGFDEKSGLLLETASQTDRSAIIKTLNGLLRSTV